MRPNQPLNNELAKVKDWGFSFSSKKGTPLMWVIFVFLEITGDEGEELDIQKDFYLTDETFEYVMRDLETLGWKGKSLEELDKTSPGYFDLSQCHPVRVTTIMEEWDGKQRAKVHFINPKDYAPNKPMEQKQVKDISAKLKAKIAAYRQKNGGNGIEKKSGIPAGEVDPDIGF